MTTQKCLLPVNTSDVQAKQAGGDLGRQEINKEYNQKTFYHILIRDIRSAWGANMTGC